MVDPAMADGSLLAFNLEGRQAGRSTNQVIASNCPAHCPTQVVNYYIPYRWNVQASHLWDSGIHLFKTHKNPANGRNPQTLCAQYDPIEVIAGLRCAPLERQQEPTKEQQQNTNKQHLCACCLCSNALKTSND